MQLIAVIIIVAYTYKTPNKHHTSRTEGEPNLMTTPLSTYVWLPDRPIMTALPTSYPWPAVRVLPDLFTATGSHCLAFSSSCRRSCCGKAGAVLPPWCEVLGHAFPFC